MKRCLFAFAAVLALAASANAVSVAIVADQAVYFQGQTVTLDIVVDPTGVQDNGVFGRFTYDPSILLGGSTAQNELTLGGGSIPWVLGVTECGGGGCTAMNQVDGINPEFVDQTAGFVISTITFTAGAVGSTDLVWITTPPEALAFFGLTDAPSITVEVVAVPEPSTVALLALGLVAVGAGRRSSC